MKSPEMKSPEMKSPEIQPEIVLDDISDIAPAKDREIKIVHPGTGEDMGIRVWVMSADDPRMSILQRQMVDRQNEARRRNKFVKAEELEAQTTELLAAAITRWDWGIRKYKGTIPEYSRSKAVEILSDANIRWFFSQINDEVGDSKAFFFNP